MTTSTTPGLDPVDHDYGTFEAAVASTLGAPGPLFVTDADPEALWDAYISSIPSEWRSHYDCHACRTFVKNYGGLVRVLDDGSRVSAVWYATAPEFFALAVVRMAALATDAKIVGVFLSSDPVLGVASNTSKRTGATWTHLHGPNARPWRETTLTAGQKMAALREDHGVLCRSFAEYGEDVAAEALRVLRSDHLDRATKATEIVEWYVRVLADRKSPALIWRHVATAPLGWCHVKNAVVSTLMDDVKNGVGFETAARKWREKMDPLAYMRPQAAPTDGAIERAEKVVEKLGIRRSLERRFARLGEIADHLLWRPCAPDAAKSGGVFDHLRKKPEGVKRMSLPAQSVSVKAFVCDVLPTAKRITIDVGSMDGFYGLTTAVHADAPPILRWDYDDERNPFAWYFYSGGSPPRRWGVAAGTHEVAAVLYTPDQWSGDAARLKVQRANGPGHLLFVISTARDIGQPGGALFPETMRGELHEVRSVIEAYSRNGSVSGAEAGDANGIGLSLDRSVGAGREVVVDGDRWLVGGKGA